MLRRLVPLTALAALLALTAAGCGGGEGAPPAGAPAATAQGDVSATLSPVGDDREGKIAFLSFRDGNREIYLMNADGSDQRNLTNDPADDFDPDWSPDGRQIVFVSDRDGGQAHIFVLDAGGSNVRRLTSDLGGVSPRWSSDGSRIAFGRGGSIAVMNADGSDLHIVMEAQPEAEAEPCRAGAFPGDWSADDRRIAYYSASVSRGIAQVCTIAADGSDIRVVVQDPPGYHVEPVFSPDDRFILYRSIRDGVHDIWLYDLETGTERNLTHDRDTDIEPDWSPDGEWIVFGSLKDGPNFDLYRMRLDGTGLRRLTDAAAKDANPVWAAR